MGHVWTVPAVQEESDVSAKRSGAAMYTACFRLEDCLCRDAAAVAAGPDVNPLIGPNQKLASFTRVARYGFSDRRSRPFRINVVITLAVREPAYAPRRPARLDRPRGSANKLLDRSPAFERPWQQRITQGA